MKKEGRKNKDWRAAAGEYAPGAGAPPALRKKTAAGIQNPGVNQWVVHGLWGAAGSRRRPVRIGGFERMRTR